MNRYRVKQGPVQPPASLYGPRPPLQTDDILESAENPWIRGCLRDQRIELEAPKARRKRKERPDAG